MGKCFNHYTDSGKNAIHIDVAELLQLDGFKVVEAKDEIIHQQEYIILILKSNQKYLVVLINISSATNL